MFDRLLLPLDAREPLPDIVAAIDPLLSGPDSPEVDLLHVIAVENGGEDLDPDRLEAVETAARGFLESARELTGLPAERVPTTIRRGDPAEQILQHAGERDASIIAMSSRGRGGMARWVLGSVAERVLRHADRPVLLLNAKEGETTEPPRPFRRILLPQDGSSAARAILPLVRDLARRYGSEVLVFHATGVTPAIAMSPGGIHPTVESAEDAGEARLAAENVVEATRRALEEVGVPVRVIVGRGNPAETILEAVEEEEADLVAMTTHGRSGVSRWIFGSVAEKVFRSCSIPLLVQRSLPE